MYGSKKDSRTNMGNRSFEAGHSEIEQLLSTFDNFKTWGLLGDLSQEHPLSMFYLVPQKRLVKPKKKNWQESGVDYQADLFVVTSDSVSYFCCRYNYSFDEFQKTNFHGSFKIKICRENKLVLDWIIRNKSILLINPLTNGTMVFDINSFLNFISKHAGFILPIHDVSALAFNDDYLSLL